MKPLFTLIALFICGIVVLESFKSNSDMNAELVLDTKSMLGEGSLWHPGEKKIVLGGY